MKDGDLEKLNRTQLHSIAQRLGIKDPQGYCLSNLRFAISWRLRERREPHNYNLDELQEEAEKWPGGTEGGRE